MFRRYTMFTHYLKGMPVAETRRIPMQQLHAVTDRNIWFQTLGNLETVFSHTAGLAPGSEVLER